MWRWLLLAALAFAPVAADAQRSPGRAPGFRAGLKFLVVSPYDPDAQAYFNAMTVQPDATRKTLLNNWVMCLKSNGVWSLLDWVSFVAAHDAQAGRINAKVPAQVATANGTIPFTTDRGYAPDGSTGYLETGVADNAGGNYSQNSASFFLWLNTTGGTGVHSGLSASTVTRITPSNGAVLSTRANAASGVSTAAVDGLQLSAAVRVDSANQLAYRNATSGTAAAASTALTGSTFQYGRTNGTFGTGRLAVMGFGGGLNGTQVTALFNCTNTPLTAIGGA